MMFSDSKDGIVFGHHPAAAGTLCAYISSLTLVGVLKKKSCLLRATNEEHARGFVVQGEVTSHNPL